MAILGPVRARLQAGNTTRSICTLAERNDGSPGIYGVTFEAIEAGGVESFLERIRDELVTGEYLPQRNRRQEIPKDGGKVRVLGIPTIRDRVVQGALKLIVEPIFEADFQAGPYGYRPQRSAHDAVERVAEAIVGNKTRVLDVDLSSYFDNVRHHLLLEKVAQRVNDGDVMALLKKILKANGKKGGTARRGDDTLNTKGNFRFERQIVAWRKRPVIDLRRKR